MTEPKDGRPGPADRRAGGLRPEPAAQSQPKALIPDAEWPEFNMNHYVKVRLTEFGIACLRQQHDELNELTKGALGAFKPPATDEEGWSKHQLWTLFSDLGKHIAMGCTVPFETMIRLDAQAIEARRAETAKTGSVADESAVPEGNAP